MKKRNITFAILLIAVVLTAVGVSGTYARYITKDSAIGIANIAKWHAEISGEVDEEYETVVVPLEFVGNDFVAEDVIAPGSTASGTLEVDLSGSEVAADIYVKIGKVYIDGAELVEEDLETFQTNFALTLADGTTAIEEGDPVHVSLDDINEPKDITVNLEWKNFDANIELEDRVEYTGNVYDTGLGEDSYELGANSHSKIEVELEVIAQQHVASDPTHTS